MAYPKSDPEFVWTAGKVYAVNDVVRASTNNTLAFKCIRAVEDQRSGANEPAFPTRITKQVVDNNLTWEAFEPLSLEFFKLAPSAVIDLFEIELTQELNGTNAVLRFHAGKNSLVQDIVYGGFAYEASPIEVQGFEFSANGTLPRPTLRVSNVTGNISSIIYQYEPIAARVSRIRTFAKFLDTVNFQNNALFIPEPSPDFVGDIPIISTQAGVELTDDGTNPTADPDAKTVETWYIDRIASENKNFVEFELTPKIDLTNLALPRRTIEEFCPWRYRGDECGYIGHRCFTVDDELITEGSRTQRKLLDVCGKRISSCQARFGTEDELPFGGFYGARLQA